MKKLKMGVLTVLIAMLPIVAGCRSNTPAGTPDYPVTVIPPVTSPTYTPEPTLTHTPEPTPTATAVSSPTLDWDEITLLPLQTPEEEITVSPEPEAPAEPTARASQPIPDSLTDADLDLLAAGRAPFSLSDAEISLGRVVLPLDLLNLEEPFLVQSVPIEDYPNWHFLAFDLPLPAEGELGAIIRSPISGEVLGGTMQMLNDETVMTVNIDHRLGEDQLLRATLVYSGTIEPLFTMGQRVEAGEALFRLTRDTGRLDTLGNTPIPDGAVLTLHANIDSVILQESGVESLKFLRGVSLTPAGFLRDEDGLILSPAN